MKSFKLAAAAAVSAVSGAALIFSATPASATNPPYDGCPGWALCLYKDSNGAGTKAIITPPAAGSRTTVRVFLYSTHFLNGELANNQATSWLNNSNCQVTFWDDLEQPYSYQIDFAPANNWGYTEDVGGTYGNDKLSGVVFYCP
jgi:hypothetical protein